MNRIGPERLVASGRARPSEVKAAALVCFGVASVLGIYLIVLSGVWWLAAVGVVALVGAWTYTGSSRPYGYSGWGEGAVWVFFGPVAVLGTMVTQAHTITWWAVVASAAVGLWAVALLMVNNIRDIATDQIAGKLTSAVRLGPSRAKQAFAAVVLFPVILAVVVAFARPWALLATATALPSLLLAVGLRIAPEGSSLKPFFGGASATGLLFGLLLALGIAL